MLLRLVVLVPWSACFGLARALDSALAVFCFIARPVLAALVIESLC